MSRTDEKLTLEQLFEDSRLYLNIYEKDKDDVDGVITESDLKTFFRCHHAYFLKKHVGLSKIPRSAFSTLALMFQQGRKSLFNLRDQEIGRLFPYQHRAGPNWKMAEDMNSMELLRYLSIGPDWKKAEKMKEDGVGDDELIEFLIQHAGKRFGNALAGKWRYFVSQGKYAGTPISWTYKKQPGSAGQHLKKAAENYYKFVIEHGAPVLGFVNTNETIDFEGTLLNVKFPEIRRGMIIDDPSLWGFGAEDKFDRGKADISDSALVTMRVLAFCKLAREVELYRMKWGIEDRVIEEWESQGIIVSPDVTYRHLNAIAGEISETHRNDADLDLLRRGIETFKSSVIAEKFEPKHTNCGVCQYNVLNAMGRSVCNEKKKGVQASVPLNYFNEKSFSTDVDKSNNLIVITGRISNEGKEPKTVARYGLKFREVDEILYVSGTYDSDVRGIGLEHRMIKMMDGELQRTSDETRKSIEHDIGFIDNFKFAGQKKIESLLSELGYNDGVKNYSPNDD